MERSAHREDDADVDGQVLRAGLDGDRLGGRRPLAPASSAGERRASARVRLDDPQDLADLGAGAVGVLLGAGRGVVDRRGAGLAEHGLGVVVGERDPAERQLLADEALQRRRARSPTWSTSRTVDGDVRRRLVAGDRLAVVAERRAQAEARRLDVLLGDAERPSACRRAPATWCRPCPSPRRPVSALACTPADRSAMSGTTSTVPWPVTVIERVAVARRRRRRRARSRRGTVAPASSIALPDRAITATAATAAPPAEARAIFQRDVIADSLLRRAVDADRRVLTFDVRGAPRFPARARIADDGPAAAPRRSSRCWPSWPARSPTATAGCSSRSGTASAASCSATATTSSWPAATSARSPATSPSCSTRCGRRSRRAASSTARSSSPTATAAGSTSTPCSSASTRPSPGSAAWRPRRRRRTSPSTCWRSTTTSLLERPAAPSAASALLAAVRPGAAGPPHAGEHRPRDGRRLVRALRGRRPRRRRRQAPRRPVPAGQAGAGQGQARAHRRLRRRRVPHPQGRQRRRLAAARPVRRRGPAAARRRGGVVHASSSAPSCSPSWSR